MSESMTQITVPDAVLSEFKQLKTRRRYKYMILSLNAETFQVEISKTGAAAATVSDLIRDLPISDARYVIYDHEFTTPDGRKRDKLYFILWTPDAAGPRSKMFYSSQRRALDGTFTGVDDIQCTNYDKIKSTFGDKAEEEEEEWDPDA